MGYFFSDRIIKDMWLDTDEEPCFSDTHKDQTDIGVKFFDITGKFTNFAERVLGADPDDADIVDFFATLTIYRDKDGIQSGGRGFYGECKAIDLCMDAGNGETDCTARLIPVTQHEKNAIFRQLLSTDSTLTFTQNIKDWLDGKVFLDDENSEDDQDGISPKSASPNKVKVIRMIGEWRSSLE